MANIKYSSLIEAKRILDILCELAALLSLPPKVVEICKDVLFTAERDFPYFPIPFKETETVAALKAVEGSVASALSSVRYGDPNPPRVTVNLEKATAFLFQAYLATVGGHGKLDPEVKLLLKGACPLLIARLYSLSNRHRSFTSAVRPISPHVGQSLQDEAPGRILSYPWLT